MLPILLATLIAAAPSSPPRMVTVAKPITRQQVSGCLKTSTFALDLKALSAERGLLSEVAWRDACRQAREADARRRSAVRVILSTGRSPLAGYEAATRLAHQAQTAADPDLRALYFGLARDQAARESTGKIEKRGFAPGAGPVVLRLLDGLSSADALAADAANQAWLKEVVARRGWFTIDRDGVAADRAARLIVQHADADLTFQGNMIALLEPLAATGRTDAKLFAYTYDRWARNTGQPQRYGAVGECVGPGRWSPRPIADEAGLEARRAAAGLPPMGQYRAQQGAECR